MWSRLSSPLTLVAVLGLLVTTVSIAGGPEIVDAGSNRSPVIDKTPTNPTTSTTATFTFAAKGESALTYECQLDARIPTRCESPMTYTELALGVHVFKVVALHGDQRSTPAHFTWTIEPTPPAPPATPVIEDGPPETTSSTSASFAFTSATPGVSYSCRLDDAAFSPCASPKSYSSVSLGEHRFDVVAMTASGLRSGVASRTWNVVAPGAPPPAPPESRPATPAITSGPPSFTTETSARFAFSSATPNVTYLCRLDSAEFAACTTPAAYTSVPVGAHRFDVKAADQRGLESGVASRTWQIGPPPSYVPPSATIRYLSDLPWTAMTNGWGPVERDRSVGENQAGDGDALRLEGVTYPKGLGAHSQSEVRYSVTAGCGRFRASIGVDDEVGGRGSVSFEVYAGASKVYDSGVMTGSTPTKVVDVSVAGVSELRLVVSNGGDGVHNDHADWGLARLECGGSSPDSPPPPQNPPATPSITSGPPSVTTETSASFAFSSSSQGVSYLCRLDSAAFAACSSPKAYAGLAVGAHRFEVKARDQDGLESGVAARTWQIDQSSGNPPPPPPPPPPGTPSITSAPPAVTNATTATFTFTGATGSAIYLCALDAGAFAACVTPKSYAGLAAGLHRFEVKTRDGAGVESGVAAATWTIDVTKPTVSVTSPTPGAQVSGVVQVVASAGDNIGVSRVEMRVDGSLKGTSTVAPHSFSWDTTRETNGQHTVELRSYDTAGNVSVPATALYVVQNSSGGGSCTGAHVLPGASIQAAVDANGQGATICIRAGTHRLTQGIVPKPGNVFVGEPGVVLSGARDITSLFTQSGSTWVATGMTYDGYGDPGWPNPCIGGGTLCLRTNDVYYDDRFLTRVGSLGEVRSGTFFFDYGADRIYIGDPPSGHRVEVGVSPHAFRSHGTGAFNVAVRALVIEKFATPASDGAIQGNDGWVLENLTVRLNHSLGVNGFDVFRNGLVYDNGQGGVSTADDTGQILEGSELHSNHRIPIICWHSGAAKFLRTTNAVLRNNYAHDDECIGLWTDWDNIGTLYEGNRVERTGGPGIFHEASFDAVIRNNTVRSTGFGPDSTGWIDGAGILVNSSRNVEIYGNVVENNRHGIAATSTDRGSSSAYGRREVKNLRVHDNAIRVTWRSPEGWWSTAGGVAGTLTQPFGGQALYERNTYTICSLTEFSGPRTAGSTTYGGLRWSEWRAQGQDANSTANVVNC